MVKSWAMPPKKNTAAARAKVLAQWRRVDYGPLEAGRTTPARHARDVLPGLLKELRLDARQAEAEIVKVWNSWLSEIVRYRRREILERLQTSYGKTAIQKISFRIG